MSYSETEYETTRERELQALDALVSVVQKYQDVIAIPEVVSISDVLDYRITTEHGVKQFKDTYGKQIAEYVLNRFAHRDVLTQEMFEDTIVSALSETKD